MGGGTWTTKSFSDYSTSIGRSITVDGVLDTAYTAQDLFKSRNIQPELNPYNVIRECRDSDEHPNTIPVILALDVTGSMGSGCAEVAKRLNTVMTDLYERVKDVEFLVMGIGDLDYDQAPIQASQFESDIRIAVQLDKIWMEHRGGGNGFESYTAAWYFGLKHTDLDCWRRGKKGIIITMGDEPLNPYLPTRRLNNVLGDTVEKNVETKELYEKVSEKYDVYHLAVDDRSTSYMWYEGKIKESFGKYMDNNHFKVVTLDNLAPTIVNIVVSAQSNSETISASGNEISW